MNTVTVGKVEFNNLLFIKKSKLIYTYVIVISPVQIKFNFHKT